MTIICTSNLMMNDREKVTPQKNQKISYEGVWLLSARLDRDATVHRFVHNDGK